MTNSIGDPITKNARILHVGVTGHRPDQLSAGDITSIRESIRESLRVLMNLTSGRVALITSLAEGADRVAAEEALLLGFSLKCPLPFDRALYEADFADEASVADFRRLLSRADSIEELPGSRETCESDQDAYAAAGYRIVELSDILLAIWNGRKARGSGGTGEIVSAARASGIPTVWIPNCPTGEKAIIAPDEPISNSLLAALRTAFA